tara:strand:+ start:4175 stop:5131 length:957 start_codon:yes stop_codon:yes gene_type:complete
MSTNIKVPTNMVKDVEKFMQAMTIDNAVHMVDKERREEPNVCEVKQILSHGVKDGFTFLIEFCDGTSEWVADENCECEWLISQYLSKFNINTNYLICRVSTKEQASSTSVSLEAQEQELLEGIESSPTQRNKVIKLTQSAYTSIPNVLISVGNACQRGDCISIYRVDRLSRNIVKFLSWLEDLNERGVEIHAVSDCLLYSMNKLDFIQLIVEAQREAALLGERIRMANMRKLKRGDEAIGSLKFGQKYIRQLDKNGNTIKKVVGVHPEEYTIINRIKVLSGDRMSPKEISCILNEEGNLKRGRKWNAGMVSYVLKQNK